MADRSRVIKPPGDTAWVYDPARNEVDFVSKATGMLYTYSLSSDAFTRTLSVGGTPASIDITPDNQFLFIGNATGVASGSAYFDFTRVNLNTGSAEQILMPYQANTTQGHLVTLSNGDVLINSTVGIGQLYYSFDATDPASTTQKIGSLNLLLERSIIDALGVMLTSADHRYVLMEMNGSAPSQILLFDATTNGVLGYLDSGHFVSGFQAGRGDVSNSGLVLDVTPDAVLIFDSHLHVVQNMSHLSTSPMFGGAFSQDGKELFLWDGRASQVLEIDTATWTYLGATPTKNSGSTINYFDPVPAHAVRLVDNGSMLALDDGVHGVEFIDLTARFGISAGAPAGPAPPTLPVAPAHLATGGFPTIVGDMDGAHLSDLLRATITDASDTSFKASGAGGLAISLQGWGFTYSNNQLVAGTINSVDFTDVQGGLTKLHFAASGTWAAGQFETWLLNDDAASAFQTLLAGDNAITAGTGSDVIHGYGGKDLIAGAGGADTIWGGAGDDIIFATAAPGKSIAVGSPGSTYLRGEDGNDYMVGGQGFDDMNGNAGQDTLGGGDGNDWVVGGKDNDVLFGEAGNDIVYGNMGDDTCVGGDGDDVVRGGQANDVMYGGAGNDWMSGDRGDDTISGGGGADIFYIFAGSGIDRITDFSRAEGDRVQVDPGTRYTVSQDGADTIVDLGGGDRMVLVGVQASTLSSGWIIGG